LVVRHPVLSDSEYDELYAQAPTHAWSDRGHREDHHIVAQRVLAAGAERVLDVGCGQGGLFQLLPRSTECFGIDPLHIDQDRFSYIGSSLFDPIAAPHHGTFDVCTATDVIEHFRNPLLALKQMALFVRPGGLLLITTGDAESRVAIAKKGKFWYVCFAEHLSFISETWAQKIEVTGVRYVESVPFRHGASGLRKLPTLAVRIARDVQSAWKSGVPGLAADHRMFVFERISSRTD
jgi:2-polyprenyl-3-methyl-5-hydroxy-6-metoxy-1,4-benzoquinol methylase